jgi:hypothetical protein
VNHTYIYYQTRCTYSLGFSSCHWQRCGSSNPPQPHSYSLLWWVSVLFIGIHSCSLGFNSYHWQIYGSDLWPPLPHSYSLLWWVSILLNGIQFLSLAVLRDIKSTPASLIFPVMVSIRTVHWDSTPITGSIESHQIHPSLTYIPCYGEYLVCSLEFNSCHWQLCGSSNPPQPHSYSLLWWV